MAHGIPFFAPCELASHSWRSPDLRRGPGALAVGPAYYAATDIDSLSRRWGKSDAIDAEAAARAVQAGTATAQPKAGDGPIEMLRSLQVARRSALKARTQAANQLQALVVTAPDSLPTRLRRLSRARLVETAATFRPRLPLSAEVDALEAQLALRVAQTARDLVAVKGIGTEIPTTLLVTAGDNPDRLRSESAFAHLCGAAPIPASSGKTNRHRLNRGGDRDANRVLHLLAVGRMGWHPVTIIHRQPAAYSDVDSLLHQSRHPDAREFVFAPLQP